MAVATVILTGEPLDIELLDAEASVRVLTWIREIAAEIGAEILVTWNGSSRVSRMMDRNNWRRSPRGIKPHPLRRKTIAPACGIACAC